MIGETVPTQASPTQAAPVPAPDQGETMPEPAQGQRSDVTEVGGREGPDPTRYGDWEKNGRCIDF